MRHLLETARQRLIPLIRRIGLVTAAASMALAVALGPAPAQADLMQFKDATTAKSFGPSAAIYIDGSLTPDPFCARGINDLVYPVTDVYIVPTGGAQGKLTDAGGKGPNTIIGLASGPFLDELIGVTAPGGTLGAGVYDIVFDTCQDGFLDPEDAVFPRAITVALPEVLPPVTPSIGRMKEVARQTYEVSHVATSIARAGSRRC